MLGFRNKIGIYTYNWSIKLTLAYLLLFTHRLEEKKFLKQPCLNDQRPFLSYCFINYLYQ